MSVNLKALRDIQENQGWLVIEEMLEEYVKTLETSSPDISDQYRLTWSIAYNKGGIEHLRAFFNLLNEEAKKC